MTFYVQKNTSNNWTIWYPVSSKSLSGTILNKYLHSNHRAISREHFLNNYLHSRRWAISTQPFLNNYLHNPR